MSEDQATILDLRGLKCPMPVLKARKAMQSMPAGAEIWLETTDPLASIDIPTFCNENDHLLLKTEQADGFQRFLIRKGAGG